MLVRCHFCPQRSSLVIYIYIYISMYISIRLRMPQNSPCLEFSHQRKVGPCHPPGMVFDPDRRSNGAFPGLDLHAMAFLASAWGLQAAGMPRRLQELETLEVAFGYLWGWRPKSWSFRKLITFGSHRVQHAAASSETMNLSCGPHASRTSFGARLPLRRCGP